MKKILRDKMHFQGAIFSDDLSMEGAVIAGSYTQRAKLSLDCGCDMVLVCNNRIAAHEVVNSLNSYTNPASSLRLAHLHGKQSLSREMLVNDPHWKTAKKSLG